MIHRLGAALALLVVSVFPVTTPASTSGPASLHSLARSGQLAISYQPSQLETAYDFAPLYTRGIDGKGATVALFEIDRLVMSDIQTFDAANHLSDPTITEHHIGSGYRSPPNGETSLDVEWLHALAPGATMQIYYLPPSEPRKQMWKHLAQALNEAETNGASIISISLGACGPSTGYKPATRTFAGLVKHGVSIFVSSGDNGDHPGPARDCGHGIGVGYPAGDPSVVSVGGTSLALDDKNAISLEIGWRRSGGGNARPLLRPSWQRLIGSLPPDKYRWAPDVAFLGDDATGVSVVMNGIWQQVGGTSLGAPAWAAIWSLVLEDAASRHQTLPAAPQLIYQIAGSTTYSQAFHDITQGSNGRYHAGPGWDAVTGWGTPDVNGLVQSIESLSPPAH